MKTSNTQASKFKSVVGKVLVALVIASMIGGISIAPAFVRDNARGGGGHAGYHGRGGYGGPHGYYRGGGYYPYGGYYAAPVYAPPPVVYAPAPYMSPGISLVLPIHIR